MDSKGRVSMPSRFATRLGDLFVITRGLQGCLWIFTREDWDNLAAKLDSTSLVNSEGLALQRYFLGSSVEISLDSHSRIAIPSLLRDFAQIEKEVMIVGASNRVEIWSKERWDSFCEELTDERIEDLAKQAGI